jgi:hypothetical protein
MERARRSPLRFLAPLALIAFALAFLLVLGSADVDDNGGSDQAAEEAEERDLQQSERERRRQEREEEREAEGEREVYIIKEGDNLSTIAEETGIPVERLLELNPELDPQALTTGQRVRLTE